MQMLCIILINATPFNKAKMGQCWAGDFSLVSQLFICDLFFKIFKSFCSFFFTFKAKIHKFYSFLRLAKLAKFARNDGKAKIQIFHSKFKAFHKFNSFYKFISNFKPYVRLFHILPQIFYIFTQIAFKNLKNSTQRSQK